jgi:hypothetical protein
MIIFIASISLFSSPVFSEEFCFTDETDNLKCIEVNIETGAGGGGCGGSSRCGNNNLETDSVDEGITTLPPKEIDSRMNDLEKIQKQYEIERHQKLESHRIMR